MNDEEWNESRTAQQRAIARRERIATAALQGSISNDNADSTATPKQHAGWAVQCADALIAELDK